MARSMVVMVFSFRLDARMIFADRGSCYSHGTPNVEVKWRVEAPRGKIAR